ncbi:MAG TPA: multiheme c-type cytochrome [Candidatus Bathyarchaeia archaeon]|nr:multiheme c-type cytochrome [Candidatus Bathyarchaeia archaeon]
MARRATAIKKERTADSGLLLISAGDFSGDPGLVEMYRSRFLARMHVEMGYQAVAVGERDLNYGIRALKADRDAGLPLICANLYEGSARVFPPYVIRKVHGARVGIMALLGESPRVLTGLELRDPAVEGRAALARLRRRCDVVILIAHMEREKLLEILPALAGVDLVIRGHAREGEKTRENCTDTLVVAKESFPLPVFSAGDRGRNLGLVTVAGSRDAAPPTVEGRLVHLDRSLGDDAATLKELAAYEADEALKRKEVQLSRSLRRDETTGRIVERYLGMDICGRCHADLMPRFVASAHFRALETLRERGAETNPECLACHATGYRRPTGYDPAAVKEGAPNLQGVQCEACHGPGTMHARDGSYVKSARESCRACHTSKWSPDFKFATYWQRVSHRAGADGL